MEGNANLSLSARRGFQLNTLMATKPKDNIQPKKFIDEQLPHQKFNDLFISYLDESLKPVGSF